MYSDARKQQEGCVVCSAGGWKLDGREGCRVSLVMAGNAEGNGSIP